MVAARARTRVGDRWRLRVGRDLLTGAERSHRPERDRPAVERQLADDPELPSCAEPTKTGPVICQAAESRSAETLPLMREFGFSPNARRFGETPLHAAA